MTAVNLLRRNPSRAMLFGAQSNGSKTEFPATGVAQVRLIWPTSGDGVGFRFVSMAGGSADITLDFFVQEAGGSETLTARLCAAHATLGNAALMPDNTTVLGTQTVAISTAAIWYSVTFTGITITAGETYWICIGDETNPVVNQVHIQTRSGGPMSIDGTQGPIEVVTFANGFSANGTAVAGAPSAVISITISGTTYYIGNPFTGLGTYTSNALSRGIKILGLTEKLAVEGIYHTAALSGVSKLRLHEGDSILPGGAISAAFNGAAEITLTTRNQAAGYTRVTGVSSGLPLILAKETIYRLVLGYASSVAGSYYVIDGYSSAGSPQQARLTACGFWGGRMIGTIDNGSGTAWTDTPDKFPQMGGSVYDQVEIATSITNISPFVPKIQGSRWRVPIGVDPTVGDNSKYLIFDLPLVDSAGVLIPGKTYADFTAGYIRDGGAFITAITEETIGTLGTWATPTSNAHIKIKETALAGWYEFQIHKDWFATGAKKLVISAATSTGAMEPIEIELVTSLTGTIDANLISSLGTALSAPLSSDDTLAALVRTKIEEAGSVLTLAAANITDALNRIPAALIAGRMAADMQAAASIVIPAGAIPAVAAGAAGGLPTVDSSNRVAGVSGNVAGSVASVAGSVGSVAGNVSGTVASVTGSVGSVAGNVSGTVASVTGSVGSVAGNIGGNVVGSVASVGVVTGRLTLKRNVGGQSVQFWMLSAVDGNTGMPGLAFSSAMAQKDSGAWAPLTNTPTEIGGAGLGRGRYSVVLTQAESNAIQAGLEFMAVGCQRSRVDFWTQE